MNLEQLSILDEFNLNSSQKEMLLKVKPGLTGYWQVSGRSDTSFDYRLKLEKYYSNNYSLKFDISIFFKTLSTLFDKESAK